jgi:hypothetical protein
VVVVPTTINSPAIGVGVRSRPAPAIGIALLAGAALGAVDFLGQRTLPYPWANLANSSAVWAVAAWALGAWLRTDARVSASAAVVMLVVAVESYYVTAALAQGDSWANVSSPTTVVWVLFGAVAGVVFGLAGSWWRSSRAWRRVVGGAVPVSVLLAEAALHLRHGTATATGLIELLLAGALLTLIARRPLPTAQIALASLPIALVGFLALTAFGFHGLGG